MASIVEGQVPCLLCREDVSLVVGGDQSQYEGHLREMHGVWSNRSWLVEQTVLEKKKQDSSRNRVKDDQTKIKVKKFDESEIENISDLQLLSVMLEDSISCEPLRRSSRKRSATRSSIEGQQTEKKVKDCGATIAIREPVDVLFMDEAEESLKHVEVPEVDCGRGVLFKKVLNVFVNMDVNMNGQNEDGDGIVSNESDDQCQVECEECRNVFKQSCMEFHVENIHGEGRVRLCGFCYQNLLLSKSKIVKEVVAEHQASLETYVEEYMKTKDVNGNISSIEADVEDVTSENLVSSSDDVKENGLVGNDSVISECGTSTDDDLELVKSDKAQSKPEFGIVDQNSTGKVYSDNYDDSCIVQCSICDKHISIERLRGHTSSQHHMPITKYKEQFGSQPTFIKTAFHICKLCGKEVQLDRDSVATHVRQAHKWTAKQYNSEYMVMRNATVGQVDEGSTLFHPRESASGQDDAQPSSMNDQHWFDANTFTCKVCSFVSNSLDTFKKHVKLTHKMSLSKFSCWYSKTNVLYTCQCCDKEVYHERSSIKAHVEGHLLSMSQYANLYEWRKILELESERKDKLESVVLVKSQELEIYDSTCDDPEKDPLEITITEDHDVIGSSSDGTQDPFPGASPSLQVSTPVSSPIQEPDMDLVQLDKSGVLEFISEIVESIIPSFGKSDAAGTDGARKMIKTAAEGACSVSSTTTINSNDEAGASVKSAASTPALPDIYLYMCPFAGCDFHTDHKGMQCGAAAKHGESVHKMDCEQLDEEGLRWKKVSLEERMEQLFAED